MMKTIILSIITICATMFIASCGGSKSQSSVTESNKADSVALLTVEELLDLKLAISKELKEFTRRISLYFLSLFKSYSKTAFTATDEHIELPKLYDTIFRAVDFLTLAGIFAKTPEISTKELVYVDNSYSILSMLLMKNNNTLRIMNQLFESQKGD